MVRVKTVSTHYLIRINGNDVIYYPSLREARQHIKTMVINDDTNVVTIVRQNLNETLLDTYETKTTKVLMATQLDEGLE